MILLDAYALVALIAEGPAAPEVERILRTEDVGMTVVNVAEALDVTQRVHRLDPAEVRQTVEPLFGSSVRVVASPEEHAWRASELRLRYYDRRTRALSLADCFLLAAAEPGGAVATADPAVAEMAHAESVRLIALPDTGGRRPP